MSEFKTTFAENIFNQKYAHEGAETWKELSVTLVDDVCGEGVNTPEPLPILLPEDEMEELKVVINQMEFIPGGRYLYYAGREMKYYNNCFLLKAEEDTSEEWGSVYKRASDCLMSGGGIGIDYSKLREEGAILKRKGGTSTGPIPMMQAVNEIGRACMQGGTRRSAIWAALLWSHKDARKLLHIKDWSPEVRALKEKDFNFPATLDMTNITINYDNAWLNMYQQTGHPGDLFIDNVRQMLKTAEPGFGFNFGDKENETLRNACTEVTSEDDSDVCNLGSINMGRIKTIERFRQVVRLGMKFLMCGLKRAHLPYGKVYDVRAKNSRVGLGLMGMHEWLLKRGYGYEVVPELHEWLAVYQEESDKVAEEFAAVLGINVPKGKRAIAPTGTIGIIASTTTGLEPMFAVAYKRRYLRNGYEWVYEYVIDGTAQVLIDEYGIDPDKIETAYSLAKDPEKRIKFQYEVQKYVDMAISSTINLPAWGSEENNESKVEAFAMMLAKYAHGLRGFTGYPDGSRGGQPLTEVPYWEAKGQTGVVFDESAEKCKGGVCSL